MKITIEDAFGKWTTVYSVPEKGILVQHAFPDNECVRTSVILPLSVAECCDILEKRRKEWDLLVINKERVQII